MKTFLKKIPIVLILCLTFVLMVFIGYGEVKRTYTGYRIETTILQSDTFLDIINPFIEAGFPLTMYSGYEGVSQTFLESNDDIDSIIVLDPDDEIVFEKSRSEKKIAGIFNSVKIKIANTDNVKLRESVDMYRIERTLPVGRDGRSGKLIFYLSKDVSQSFLYKSYRIVFYFLIAGCFLITLAFYIFTSHSKKTRSSERKAKDSIIKIFYLIIFIILGSVVTVTTIQIYNAGVRGKADAIGILLAGRLYPVAELGLEFEDLSGVDTILSDFKERYDIVDSVSLITSQLGLLDDTPQKGFILYDSNPIQIGQFFQPDLSRFLIFDAPLFETTKNGQKERLIIKISVPRKEITMAVFNSLINFTALLIGCGLIAMIFLNVGLAVAASLRREQETSANGLSATESLQLIKAAYFLVVFISAMAVPFLPLLVSELNSGTVSSLPFMVYYLAFAMVLIPSGNMAGKGKIKETMALGFISELIGGLLIAFSTSLPLLTMGRAICGIGQGFFLIGFQSYVISVTPPEKRTQGAAIKVIARNSALIAGTAIGALLYVFMGYRNLFILSAAISILGFLYLLLMVPKTGQQFKNPKKLELKNIAYVFKDSGFLKVLLLTGIPAKMGITGVVNFAVPLLMGSMGYSPEVIGRFLMLFFIISMMTTKIASKQADRSGNTTSSLFFSALMGGTGMLLIGFHSLILGQSYQLITIGGLMMIGIGNGLISAPIVTQITKTKSSNKVGHSSMIAVYTFLERFGHVLGPGILSTLIVFAGNQTAIGIGLFGAITLFLGLLFPLITRKKEFSRENISNNEKSLKISSEKTPGVIYSLGIKFDDIHTSKLMSNTDYFGAAYQKELDALRSQISMTRERTGTIEDGHILFQIPSYRDDDINTICEKALTISKKSKTLNGNDDLGVYRIGIHAHQPILSGIDSSEESINLNPAAGFSKSLASLNETYGSSIIISSHAKKRMNNSFQTGLLDIVQIPGTRDHTPIYELIGSDATPASDQNIKISTLYMRGYKHYINKNFDKALEIIAYMREKLPQNKAVRQLYQRIILVKTMPELVTENWKGIIN